VDACLIDLTELFVLPDGAVLTPVRALPQAFRASIGPHDETFTLLSRQGSRAPSRLMNQQMTSLVAQFRAPKTIAQAVARHSRESMVAAEAELEEALPILHALIEADLLIPFDPKGATAITSSRPTALAGWSILNCVQKMDDVEVYRVCREPEEYAALKIACADNPAAVRAIKHEAAVLSCLDSPMVPRLLSTGSHDSRAYLILEWIAGVEVWSICNELRRVGDAAAIRSLLALMGAIIRAYAHIHDRGVVHGDVNPRNILISPDRCVKLLDFGAARTVRSDAAPAEKRAGVSFFFEPEFAKAARARRLLPPPTREGEQYSLGALVYYLIAGRHYLDFIVEKTEMLRQIAEDPMLPFARRGVTSAPAEILLHKALSKAPADRFSSIAEFSRAWDSYFRG